MSNYQQPPEGRDPELWEIAQKRASFKGHMISYIIVNLFLWAVWYFTDGHNGYGYFPWPVWSTLGWGIGLSFHFMSAYVFPHSNLVEREYQKLKNQNQHS